MMLLYLLSLSVETSQSSIFFQKRPFVSRCTKCSAKSQNSHFCIKLLNYKKHAVTSHIHLLPNIRHMISSSYFRHVNLIILIHLLPIKDISPQTNLARSVPRPSSLFSSYETNFASIATPPFAASAFHFPPYTVLDRGIGARRARLEKKLFL